MKEKEKHELEKKHWERQAAAVEELKTQISAQKKALDEGRKKLKKKDHMILLGDQGYQTLKKMHEKDKAFWDDQLREQRKKNEKLTMELANIFQNSIQNKNAEEELRKMFENKYKQLTTEMNQKEESFKNKFAKNVRVLKKNEESLGAAKKQLELEKRALAEKSKNLERLRTQLLELKGKESRLQERLEQQGQKHAKERAQTRERFAGEKGHLEKKLGLLEAKLEKVENDNKKKQNQLFAGSLTSLQPAQRDQAPAREGAAGQDGPTRHGAQEERAAREEDHHAADAPAEPQQPRLRQLGADGHVAPAQGARRAQRPVGAVQ